MKRWISPVLALSLASAALLAARAGMRPPAAAPRPPRAEAPIPPPRAQLPSLAAPGEAPNPAIAATDDTSPSDIASLLAADPATQARLAIGLRKRPTPDRVRALMTAYRATAAPRSRALLLYLLACSRPAIADADRDATLDSEAVPFLREVASAERTDATRPAFLALSALGTPEAARVLTDVARDPGKAEEALSSLATRPTHAALEALEGMAREGGEAASRVRALRTLLVATRLWDGEADFAARGVVAETRRFLAWEGRVIAESLASDGDARDDAQAVLREIESLP